MSYDVIVIGSGFGGAVAACRLAEAGARVLVLERGRRWLPHEYPRRPSDPWVWDADQPHRYNGWIDFRKFPRIAVVQGAGVGGGSLIYANISVEAPAAALEHGWPDEIRFDSLKPYYEKVARFMNVQTVPENQWPARTHLMREAANKLHVGERFKPVPLAVAFDPDWTYDQFDRFDTGKSRTYLNDQGVEQGTCIHLGYCDIGCPVKAKNTLDLNYIPWAEKHGAEVRPLHQVSHVEPLDDETYRVWYQRLDGPNNDPDSRGGNMRNLESEDAKLVVVAAGSLGSTELLLRSRDQFGTLSRLSPRLGHGWSSNGDFLTPAIHAGRDVLPTRGPTITSAIDFLDGSRGGQSFWIQDGGFPDLMEDYLKRLAQEPPRGRIHRVTISLVKRILGEHDAMRRVMPWFAQGIDQPVGRFRLRRRWWLTGPKRLTLNWPAREVRPVIDEIVKAHRELAQATGGRALVPPSWTVAHYLVTPHPLGGCGMGHGLEDGVVDHRGEVFGHPRLYVLDGAIFPRAIGVNPSRTIAALAERAAELIVREGRI